MELRAQAKFPFVGDGDSFPPCGFPHDQVGWAVAGSQVLGAARVSLLPDCSDNLELTDRWTAAPAKSAATRAGLGIAGSSTRRSIDESRGWGSPLRRYRCVPGTSSGDRPVRGLQCRCRSDRFRNGWPKLRAISPNTQETTRPFASGGTMSPQDQSKQRVDFIHGSAPLRSCPTRETTRTPR